MTEEEACKLFRYVMDRAQTDMAFRSGLLNHPRQILEKTLNIDLPPEFNIRFVENKGADLTVVLPDPDGTDRRAETANQDGSDEE
jgi:hypothetical protein